MLLILLTRRRFRRVRISINDGLVTSVLVTTSEDESTTTTSKDELSLLIVITTASVYILLSRS